MGLLYGSEPRGSRLQGRQPQQPFYSAPPDVSAWDSDELVEQKGPGAALKTQEARNRPAGPAGPAGPAACACPQCRHRHWGLLCHSRCEPPPRSHRLVR